MPHLLTILLRGCGQFSRSPDITPCRPLAAQLAGDYGFDALSVPAKPLAAWREGVLKPRVQLQDWAKLIQAEQTRHPLSSRDGKLLKPVPSALSLSEEQLVSAILAILDEERLLEAEESPLQAWINGLLIVNPPQICRLVARTMHKHCYACNQLPWRRKRDRATRFGCCAGISLLALQLPTASFEGGHACTGFPDSCSSRKCNAKHLVKGQVPWIEACNKTILCDAVQDAKVALVYSKGDSETCSWAWAHAVHARASEGLQVC